MWHMGDGSGWWMISGWLWMIVVVALVAWGITRLTSGGRAMHRPGPEPSARELLDRRYSAGELTDEQYQMMRRQLNQPSGT